MRASVQILTVAAAAAAIATPTLAQNKAARPVAGCKVAALNQQSRVVEESDFYKAMDEIAAYWQGQLETVEPDVAKREVLLAGAREALDKDLATVSRTEGMMRVGAILEGCRREREKRGVKP